MTEIQRQIISGADLAVDMIRAHTRKDVEEAVAAIARGDDKRDGAVAFTKAFCETVKLIGPMFWNNNAS